MSIKIVTWNSGRYYKLCLFHQCRSMHEDTRPLVKMAQFFTLFAEMLWKSRQNLNWFSDSRVWTTLQMSWINEFYPLNRGHFSLDKVLQLPRLFYISGRNGLISFLWTYLQDFHKEWDHQIWLIGAGMELEILV